MHKYNNNSKPSNNYSNSNNDKESKANKAIEKYIN